MKDNETPSASDWGDWDFDQPSQSTEAETSQTSFEDDWSVPLSSNQAEESGGFISEDDDWSTPTPELNNDDWGRSAPVSNPRRTSDNWRSNDTYYTDTVNHNPIKETPPKPVELGKKTIGFIIAGALILLALLFLLLDNINISFKKTQPTNPSVNQGYTETQQGSVNLPQGSITLVEIPDTMNLTYSGSVYETNGVVLRKTKYVQGHQVLYCITVQATIGSTAESINYYCNYASFTAVAVGDVVLLKFQQVDDGYISVNEIRK